LIFVLDNYDSFTYNLVQYLGEMGCRVEVRRNDRVTLKQIEAMAPERIVISPGPCTPREAGISIDLIRHFAARLPILGVCLGHQAMGEAFGGVVGAAPVLMHGKVSKILHDGRTIFRDLPQGFEATRYHSLVVFPESVPKELEVSARTPEGVIMGLRHKQHKVEGVQFHPESILTKPGKQLLKNFLEL
jgi:anthranilate synthase/aminodeoxychorismate synthase-like glutamine amidotransferase